MPKEPEINIRVNAEIGAIARCFAKINLGIALVKEDGDLLDENGKAAVRSYKPRPLDAELAQRMKRSFNKRGS